MIYRTSEIWERALTLSQLDNQEAITWAASIDYLNQLFQHIYDEVLSKGEDGEFRYHTITLCPSIQSSHKYPLPVGKIIGVYEVISNPRNECKELMKLRRDQDYFIDNRQVVVNYNTDNNIEVRYYPPAPILTYPIENAAGQYDMVSYGFAAEITTSELGDPIVSVTDLETLEQYDYVRNLAATWTCLIYDHVFELVGNQLRDLYTNTIVDSAITQIIKNDTYLKYLKGGRTYTYSINKGITSETIIGDDPVTTLYYDTNLGHIRLDAQGNVYRGYTMDNDDEEQIYIVGPGLSVFTLIPSNEHLLIQVSDGSILIDNELYAPPLFKQQFKDYIVKDYCLDQDIGYGMTLIDPRNHKVMSGAYTDTLLDWPDNVYYAWMQYEVATQILIAARQQDLNLEAIRDTYWNRLIAHAHRDIGSLKKLNRVWPNINRRYA